MLCQSLSLGQFRSRLKTKLFNRACYVALLIKQDASKSLAWQFLHYKFSALYLFWLTYKLYPQFWFLGRQIYSDLNYYHRRYTIITSKITSFELHSHRAVENIFRHFLFQSLGCQTNQDCRSKLAAFWLNLLANQVKPLLSKPCWWIFLRQITTNFQSKHSC